MSRLGKLRSKLEELELDAILITQAENRRYLSGFTGSAGYLLVSQGTAILATDFRYVEQASGQSPDFEIVRIEGELPKWFSEVASRLGAKRLGFEGSALSFAAYQQLKEATTNMVAQVRPGLVPTEGLVESLRAIKEEPELKSLERAAALADAAWEHVSSWLEPGLTERQVAWELESFLRQHGSEAIPFDIIVASGASSARPHAQPGDGAILRGKPIVIDLGARVGGYCSDLTRTICLGEVDDTFARIYDITLGAQLTAIATLEAGMSGEQADRLARAVIEQAGYGEAFGHGLGHGVGLVPHEEPRVGKGSSAILADNMVFTIEPGIYINGWGGIRIEDMAVLERGKPRLLSKAKKGIV